MAPERETVRLAQGVPRPCGLLHAIPATATVAGLDYRLLLFGEMGDREVFEAVSPICIIGPRMGLDLACVRLLLARAQLALLARRAPSGAIATATARQIRHRLLDHEHRWLSFAQERGLQRLIRIALPSRK